MMGPFLSEFLALGSICLVLRQFNLLPYLGLKQQLLAFPAKFDYLFKAGLNGEMLLSPGLDGPCTLQKKSISFSFHSSTSGGYPLISQKENLADITKSKYLVFTSSKATLLTCLPPDTVHYSRFPQLLAWLANLLLLPQQRAVPAAAVSQQAEVPLS